MSNITINRIAIVTELMIGCPLKPGLNNSAFHLILDKPIRHRTSIITNKGKFVRIMNSPIRYNGTEFIHTCRLESPDPRDYLQYTEYCVGAKFGVHIDAIEKFI